ncbi:MAG: serine/threonine-protein kinase [Planctomycetota bacterium]|nr:serine/threonine-protein kinase [Planctomycetota bacterium]
MHSISTFPKGKDMLVPADVMAAKLIGQLIPIPPAKLRELMFEADAAPDSSYDLVSRLSEAKLLPPTLVSKLRRYLAHFDQARYQTMCLKTLKKHQILNQDQVYDLLANLEASPYHSRIGTLLIELGYLNPEQAGELELQVRRRLNKEDFAVLARYRKEKFQGVSRPLVNQPLINTSVFKASVLFHKPEVSEKIANKIRELREQRAIAAEEAQAAKDAWQARMKAQALMQEKIPSASNIANAPITDDALKAFVTELEDSLESALDRQLKSDVFEDVEIDAHASRQMETARYKLPKQELLYSSSEREDEESDELDFGELEEIGPYDVVECLGQGGMGAVYMGRNVDNGTLAAVKVILQEKADAENLSRFFREATITGLVDHPGVIRLIGSGETEEGLVYMGISLCAGKPLEKILEKEGRLSPKMAFHIFEQLLEGLEHVHQKKIIHRDLKPENIFVQAGKEQAITVMDFGIARIMDEDKAAADRAFQTKAGIVSGSPAYIAPETISGDPIDHRTDIYSLGCIFYRMLTGRMPLFAETPYDYLREHLVGIPMTLFQGHREGNWCAEIEQLMASLLAKEKADRPSSCAEILNKIRDGGIRKKTLETFQTPLPDPAKKGKTSVFNSFFKIFGQ